MQLEHTVFTDESIKNDIESIINHACVHTDQIARVHLERAVDRLSSEIAEINQRLKPEPAEIAVSEQTDVRPTTPGPAVYDPIPPEQKQ
jgi:hypothetical protein